MLKIYYVILKRILVHNQISIINCQVHGIPQDRCLCRGKNKSRISFILFLNEKSILVLDQGTNDEIISYQDEVFNRSILFFGTMNYWISYRLELLKLKLELFFSPGFIFGLNLLPNWIRFRTESGSDWLRFQDGQIVPSRNRNWKWILIMDSWTSR